MSASVFFTLIASTRSVCDITIIIMIKPSLLSPNFFLSVRTEIIYICSNCNPRNIKLLVPNFFMYFWNFGVMLFFLNLISLHMHIDHPSIFTSSKEITLTIISREIHGTVHEFKKNYSFDFF